MIDIQYRTARIDNSEQTIDIKSVKEEFRKNRAYRSEHVFNCPCCGEEMEAVLGEIRTEYFRHKANSCGETDYLHSTAEEVFFEEYKKCLENGKPFEITVYPEIKCDPDCSLVHKETCPKRYKGKTVINLSSIYKTITPEKRVYIDNRFRRPDLLLESESGEKLWVELWVSHKTDEEKRKLESILEIKISSHDDIEKIRSHKLLQSEPKDKRLKYYGWKEVCSDPELPREEEENTVEDADGLLTGPSRQSDQSQQPQAPWTIDNPPIDIGPSIDVASLPELQVRGDTPYWKRDKGISWVNLGLPSGTLWSKEYMGSMSFEDAQREFPGMIPSLEQYIELISTCETTRPYPAGFIGTNGALMEMYEGDFWTNRSLNEKQAVVFHKEDIQGRASRNKPSLLPKLGFAKANKEMRLCVRLVKKVR